MGLGAGRVELVGWQQGWGLVVDVRYGGVNQE